MYQFKAKDSETKPYQLYLGNISIKITIDNMNNTGWKGYVNAFSVDYNVIDTNDILDICKCLMEIT